MDAVKQEMLFAWDMYKQYAWGEDYLKPISRTGARWVGAGITIVDALDTLWLMDLKEQFNEGVQWIKESFDTSKMNGSLPLFETCIRVLGGLLGAFTFSKDPVLVQKADEVGEHLFHAIRASPSTFPHPTAMWKAGTGSGPQIVLAEVATLQMEFVFLAAGNE